MHIVYVGYPGFPDGHAQVERQKLIAKGLEANGCKVTVICRYGIQEEGSSFVIPEVGEYENIEYRYASGLTFRPNSFPKRNFFKLKGLIRELRLILKYKSEYNLDVVFITTNSFYNVVYYSLIALICRVPSVLDNVEYWSSRQGIGFWEKFDNFLYDRYAYKLASKVICISDFLLQIVQRGSPGKPVLKVPAIVDYDKFQYPPTQQIPYFLFCGSAVYIEIIDFILKAYEKLGTINYKLYLVTNGSNEQMDRVKKRIEQSPSREAIHLFSSLSYDALTRLYLESSALLIPLLNRQQDIARFPHKIGEYCASRRVIVTTNIGEIKYYFKDQENALVAEQPNIENFAIKMQQVMADPDAAERLAINSFLMGKEHFDYRQLGKKVFGLLQTQKGCPKPLLKSV